MSETKKKHFKGVASLYDDVQLRDYFLKYIYFVIGTEILIFLVCFFGSIGPERGPFPWKFYFFVSFTFPVAVTFILGVLIIAFNNYLFGSDPDAPEGSEIEGRYKISNFFNSFRSVPFLAIMFLLIAGSILAYKLDTILLTLFNAGEKVVQYVLISLGVLLVAGLILGAFFILANYLLRKKQMEYHFKYKDDVMERMGLLIMNDDTVINKDGIVISEGGDNKMIEMADQDEKRRFQILPPPN